MTLLKMLLGRQQVTNVMLTYAGRRNYLVKFFREALRGRGQVFAADASPEAPALRDADKSFIVPRLSHPAYIDSLLAICQLHCIRLLISPDDLELQVLARNRHRFLKVGTIAVVSSPEVTDKCFDKWMSLKFLKSCHLDVPVTYLSLTDVREGLARGDITLPVVIKPRWGTTSIGIEYPEDWEELELGYLLARKRIERTALWEMSATDPGRCILVQQLLCGQEYGLDVVNDLEGRHVCTLVKRKLAMRAGQTDRAVTVNSARLEKIGGLIGSELGHIGVLDCDVMVTEQGCYVLDMNPRLGGGYPFSHMAGANLPAALIAWANGEQPDTHWLQVEPNIVTSKYDSLVTVNKELTAEDPDPASSRIGEVHTLSHGA
jgi:carbamoyl-phosphate synthase large subunit